MAGFNEKYTFKVEWLDQQAALKRYYLLQYYVMNGTNELELVRVVRAGRGCPFVPGMLCSRVHVRACAMLLAHRA